MYDIQKCLYEIQKKMQEDYIHEKSFYFTLVETSEKGTR